MDPPGELLGSTGVKQVGAVLHGKFQAVGGAVRRPVLGEVERQVELGHVHVHPLQRGDRVAQVDGGGRGVVQRQGDLEERVPGQVPGRVDPLNELLERQVLVGVGGRGGLPHPVQQLGESRIARGVRA